MSKNEKGVKKRCKMIFHLKWCGFNARLVLVITLFTRIIRNLVS